MPKLEKWIDASKYDIRLTWTGPKTGELPADASLVEGWPFDPPDEFPGWHMVDFGISEKDEDSYWVLWTRPKTVVKKKRRARKQKATTTTSEPTSAAAPAPTTPAPTPRTRKPKPAKANKKKGREEVLAGARARLEEKQNEATPPAAE